MFFKALIIHGILLAFIAKQAFGSQQCFLAKTCIHNGKEKCGEDKNGNVRRFFDSCDLKEYNCLKETDFVKTDLTKCESLPLVEEESKNKITKSERRTATRIKNKKH